MKKRENSTWFVESFPILIRHFLKRNPMSVSLSSTQWDHAKNPYPWRVGRPDYEIKWNLISWIDFQWRINYLIIKDWLDLWSKYPNLDDGSQDFFYSRTKSLH